MTSPPAPSSLQTSTTQDGINLTWNHNVTWFGFDGDDGTLGGFDEGIWLHPDNGFRVYYREKGATTFTEFSDISVDDTSELVDALDQDKTYEFKVRVYTGTEYSESSIVEGTTFLNETRNISSHALPITTSTIRITDLNRNSSSYTNSIGSSSVRVVDLLATPLSESKPITSTADRNGLQYEKRELDQSYISPITSFIYNERTSLEVIDQSIRWDDDKAVWYTDWFSETKILGSEDQLAIRSLVVQNAKQPAAKVVMQYDSDGDGVVDKESETIYLGKDQSVKTVSGIPIDEDGYYRIKIMEYSGYNSLYAIDTAIVH